MEKKKTKLTISGSSKKTMSSIEIAKTQGRNSVLIGKKPNKFYSAISNDGITSNFTVKTKSFSKVGSESIDNFGGLAVLRLFSDRTFCRFVSTKSLIESLIVFKSLTMN